MATSRSGNQRQAKSGGDATGKKQARLEAEVVEDQKKQDEITMISRQQEQESLKEEIDYTHEGERAKTRHDRKTKAEERAEAEIVTEGGSAFDLNEKIKALKESDDPALQALAADYERLRAERETKTEDAGVIQAGQPTQRIRTNVDIEAMTLGVGTEYHFKAGQWYRVPTNVARHLEERDLLML